MLLVKIFLKGELTDRPAMTIAASSKLVNWGHFLPQQEDSAQIMKIQEDDKEHSNQDLNEEEGINKPKKRSSAEKLGTLTTVSCNVLAIANIQGLLSVLFEMGTNRPIYYQLLMQMAEFLNSEKFTS